MRTKIRCFMSGNSGGGRYDGGKHRDLVRTIGEPARGRRTL